MRSIVCWMDCAARMRQRCEASLLWWQTGRRKNRTSHRRCIHSRIPRRHENPATFGRHCLRQLTTQGTGDLSPTESNGAMVGPTQIPTVWTATRSGSPASVPWPYSD